jgi:mannose-1-phosphate guanylyltransferase
VTRSDEAPAIRAIATNSEHAGTAYRRQAPPQSEPRSMSRYSGIILAGGDGARLSWLTRKLAGDERPKQFCRLIGDDSLLGQTRRRARLMVAPERLLTVVMRHHERFYAPTLADAPPRSIVAQPNNRGTAPAVLYALMRLGSVAPADPVVVLPSDHYVSDDEAFMARVEGALEAVGRRPEVVVLLGIAPDRPEVEYGWIEPAEFEVLADYLEASLTSAVLERLEAESCSD